jgi:hypothetical protein
MRARRASAISIVTAAMCLAGCATAPMSGPAVTDDWRVQTGQAIWTPKGAKAGIAGELMMATNSTGDFVVEFSKPPFTIASARRMGERWQADFPGEQKRFGGRGKGPERIIWLRLPEELRKVETRDGNWRIERGTEKLEGYFAQ